MQRISEGQKFGKWNVVKRRYGSTWICRCECGNISDVVGTVLKNGRSSCCSDCSKRNKKHGKTKTPIYAIWEGMKRRCQNPNNVGFQDYGAKGITVCEAWQNFENFYADMGERPEGKSLDRIDGSLGYYKENCRWAMKKEQARNMKSNSLHTVNGKTATIAEWAEIKGMPARQLRLRMVSKGITMAEAMELPYIPYKPKENK